MLEVEQIREEVHPDRLDITSLVAGSRAFTCRFGILRLEQHQFCRVACARPKSASHIEERHNRSGITFRQGEELDYRGMVRQHDGAPTIHIKYRFLDVDQSFVVRRVLEQRANDLGNFFPMKARGMLPAPDPAVQQVQLGLRISVAQGVVRFSKTVHVVVDKVVADDGGNGRLVVSVVPPNSEAGNYLRSQN